MTTAATRRFVFRLVFGVFVNLAIYGGLLFLPAGTWHWWRAWVFLAVLFVATLVTMLTLFPQREGLLNERMRGLIQRGQPLADKILVTLGVAEFCAVLAFIPIDVFRLHLLPNPSLAESSLGMALFLAGWTIIALVFQANPFAAPVVKYQQERGHTVIDRGPYAVVRHPMYSGTGLMMIGIALWLESYAAAIGMILMIVTLSARIHFEERFLRRELPGYEAYTQRVRYRLIPFLW
jgi:protein-S-isoprenylcysteine O-methyltransferase Ste14